MEQNLLNKAKRSSLTLAKFETVEEMEEMNLENDISNDLIMH